MPSPKKSKSPARSRSRGRSTKASRSRSRSSGRKSKSASSSVTEVKVVSKSPSRSTRSSRSTSKSPSRASRVETVVTKRTIISSESTMSNQEQASVTPVRTSSRIASLVEREKENSIRLAEQMKAEMLSSIKTAPKSSIDLVDGKVDTVKEKKEKSVRYEFMGPIGAFLLFFLLPLTVYYVNLACNKKRCTVMELPKVTKLFVQKLFSLEATLVFLGWFFFQAILAVLPVGRVVSGLPLKSGGRLKYRCNGFFALVVSLASLLGAAYFKCAVVTFAYDKFFQLMTSATIFSIILSVCLYVSSRFVSEKKLAPGGNTGNVIYDFFIGRELNPRVGPLDLKFFCELRPGLIGWVVLDWVMVIKAYQDTGAFPPNLVLITAFQTLYVADALWNEEAILSTMDIIHDGFGFMLAFGDLVWVPFLYCLQPRFLLENKFELPWYCLAPIALANLLGFAIFRMANSQKNTFRRDPKSPAVANLETMPTNQSGKKLLVSGWWGICRKPNYLGDLIMACCWSLITGFGHILTYFYPLYFLVLLIHRERRDNEQCQNKYGASWDKYCERVKYRIFPYVY